MNGYIAFLKKEFIENIRNYRIFLLFAVFLLFGFSSPILAKLLPEILSSMDMNGLKLQIPDPVALDSYAQFFKNISQMGLITLLLLFGGTLSNEFSKGTLINMVTKGLSRNAVIIAKFSVCTLLWTTALILSGIITHAYTLYLFPGQAPDHLIFSIFCLWLFGDFMIVLILFFSTLVKGSFGGIAPTACFILLMSLMNMFPWAAKWNPISLASNNTALLSGSVTVSSQYSCVVATSLLLLGGIALTLTFFRKKSL